MFVSWLALEETDSKHIVKRVYSFGASTASQAFLPPPPSRRQVFMQLEVGHVLVGLGCLCREVWILHGPHPWDNCPFLDFRGGPRRQNVRRALLLVRQNRRHRHWVEASALLHISVHRQWNEGWLQRRCCSRYCPRIQRMRNSIYQVSKTHPCADSRSKLPFDGWRQNKQVFRASAMTLWGEKRPLFRWHF